MRNVTNSSNAPNLSETNDRTDVVATASASATARWQSRAIGYDGNFASLNYMGNIENPVYREFLVHFATTLLDGTHYGLNYTSGPVDGVLCDLGRV